MKKRKKKQRTFIIISGSGVEEEEKRERNFEEEEEAVCLRKMSDSLAADVLLYLGSFINDHLSLVSFQSVCTFLRYGGLRSRSEPLVEEEDDDEKEEKVRVINLSPFDFFWKGLCNFTWVLDLRSDSDSPLSYYYYFKRRYWWHRAQASPFSVPSVSITTPPSSTLYSPLTRVSHSPSFCLKTRFSVLKGRLLSSKPFRFILRFGFPPCTAIPCQDYEVYELTLNNESF